MPDPAKLRQEGLALSTSIKAAQARLTEINAALIEGGAGKFEECTVVDGSVSYAYPKEATDQKRLEELAGENLGKLFSTVRKTTVTETPVKGFAAVVGALFKGPTVNAILNRCSVKKAGYVKWADS